MTRTVIRGDAANLPLPDSSVDLIVTSPPYFALRSYKDGGEHYAGQIGDESTPAEFVAALIRCTREWMRVLKPSGSLWVNLGDKYSTHDNPRNGHGGSLSNAETHAKRTDSERSAGIHKSNDYGVVRQKSLIGIPWRYALACIDDLGLILRAEVIWSKPNGLPESVTDRVRRSHETWFHFTLQPRYFSSVDAIREAHAAHTLRYYPPGGDSQPRRPYADDSGRGDGGGFVSSNPRGKLPGSVWTIATQPLTVPDHLGVDHFAAFPMEWPRRIIRGWAPKGGTVLDPFGGTGTTALIADVEGCHGISVDLSHDYCRLAEWRTTDPGERARAMQVAKPEPVMEGQQVLV